jgi:hypothetical protein
LARSQASYARQVDGRERVAVFVRELSRTHPSCLGDGSLALLHVLGDGFGDGVVKTSVEGVKLGRR